MLYSGIDSARQGRKVEDVKCGMKGETSIH